MADWIRATARGSGALVLINLDGVSALAAADGGSSITLPSGGSLAVNEPPEELIVQISVRRHA